MESFILKIEDYDQTSDLNHFLATNLTKIISTTNIIEYDIQIVEDKSVLFKLVDNHYLLLNKIAKLLISVNNKVRTIRK